MKDYKQKLFVRVLDSTYSIDEEAKSVIGQVCEVRQNNYNDSIMSVYELDKTDYHWFNYSDLQIVFPECVNDGHVIGVGDVVIRYDRFVVYDAYQGDRNWVLLTHKKNDENDTYPFVLDERFKVEPLYKSNIETLEIGGRKYSKKDVENALKDIKEVK